MAQKDYIIGNVIDVLDGGTVKVQVTRVGKDNIMEYGEEEKVWIKRLKFVDVVSDQRKLSTHPKPLLKRMLADKEILCLVHSRNKREIIEADVALI